jgi:hypothetical protein
MRGHIEVSLEVRSDPESRIYELESELDRAMGEVYSLGQLVGDKNEELSTMIDDLGRLEHQIEELQWDLGTL